MSGSVGSGSRPARGTPGSTLAAVAALVGVSRTTVSNAYNRPDQLSIGLRDTILAAAAQLGYSGPDPVARSLRTKQADAVGLIASERLGYTFRDPASVEFVHGLAEACTERGKSLLLIAAAAASSTATVSRAAVDGFVMASMAAGNPFLAAAFARPNPVVIVDSPVGVRGVDFVGIDDRAGFRMLAEHLSGLGHSRIGVITVRRGEDEAPASSLWSLADSIRTGRTPHAVRQLRLSGLRDVVGEQAAESSVRVAERTFCSREEGALGAADLLDTVDGLTALMCTADIMALGALDELTRRGLRAGRDVAVTGFDDIPAAAPAGLTTVRQPLELKGRAAVESLLDDRPRSRAKRTILPISLVARDSSQG